MNSTYISLANKKPCKAAEAEATMYVVVEALYPYEAELYSLYNIRVLVLAALIDMTADETAVMCQSHFYYPEQWTV